MVNKVGDSSGPSGIQNKTVETKPTLGEKEGVILKTGHKALGEIAMTMQENIINRPVLKKTTVEPRITEKKTETPPKTTTEPKGEVKPTTSPPTGEKPTFVPTQIMKVTAAVPSETDAKPFVGELKPLMIPDKGDTYRIPGMVTGNELLKTYGHKPRHKFLVFGKMDTNLRAAVKILDKTAPKLNDIKLNAPGMDRQQGLKTVSNNLDQAIQKLEAQRDKFNDRAKADGSSTAEKTRAADFAKVDTLISDLKLLKNAVDLLHANPNVVTDKSTAQTLEDMSRAGVKNTKDLKDLLTNTVSTSGMRRLAGGMISTVFLDEGKGKVYKLLNEGIHQAKNETGQGGAMFNQLGRNHFAYLVDKHLCSADPTKIQTTDVRLVMTEHGPAIEQDFLPGTSIRDGYDKTDKPVMSVGGANAVNKLLLPSSQSQYELNLRGAGMRIEGEGDEARIVPLGKPSFSRESIKHPDIVRGMVDLQVKDFLRNQVDRHMGNVKVDTSTDPVKVWGLDEDACGGAAPTASQPVYPTIIPQDTAQGVLNLQALLNAGTDTKNAYIALLGNTEAQAFFDRVNRLADDITSKKVETIPNDAWTTENVDLLLSKCTQEIKSHASQMLGQVHRNNRSYEMGTVPKPTN